MSVRPEVLAKKEGKKHTLQFFLFIFLLYFILLLQDIVTVSMIN